VALVGLGILALLGLTLAVSMGNGPGSGAVSPPIRSGPSNPDGGPSPGRTPIRGDTVFVVLVPDQGDTHHIIGLDTASGATAISLATDFDPAAAVTPDDLRLYVASGEYLSEIDPSSGATLKQTRFGDRWMNTLPAYFPTMALSPGGRWLFVLKHRTAGAEADVYSVAVYDTVKGQFLEEELSLPGCAGGFLLPDTSTLTVACTHLGLVLSSVVNHDGSFGLVSSTKASERRLVGAARVPGRAETLVLTDNGRVLRLGRDGVVPIMILADDTSAEPILGSFAVSPDGSRLFVGIGDVSTRAISHIETYAVSSGERLAQVELPNPAFTMALAASGALLYATAYDARELMVIDADTLRILDRFALPERPSLVLP
jgi:hypothetical protein